MAFDKELERTRLDGLDNHDINLYVEQKVTFLHARMDLKPAVLGLVTLKLFVHKLETSVANPMNKVLAKNLDRRVMYLANQLARIVGKDYLANRNKRSIEIIGNLISELFGNPGPEDWKKNNLNILALKNAIGRISENSNIDHADIDLNRNIIEKHNVELKALNLALNRNQNELVEMNDELTSMRTYFEISTMVETIDRLITALLEIKNDGAKGFCSDRAIDRSFLIENIQGLEANKAGLTPIFESWQWRQYYRYEMCTLAIEKEALWITLRVPMVRKAENLVRVVPNANIRFVLSKINGLGLDVALFREKNNDNYHIMTQTSLDMCNILGNTRTCGVRDAKFRDNQNLIVPVEFAHNKFVVVGGVGTLKLMERCIDQVMERNVEFNSVIVVPDNCSYVSTYVTIGTRDSDLSVMKLVGLVSVEKFEMRKIENLHWNFTNVVISEVANKSISSTYERNRKEILESLREIDTKHDSNWGALFYEKWILVGVLCSVAVLLTFAKAYLCCRKRRVRQDRRERYRVEFTKGRGELAGPRTDAITGLLKEANIVDVDKRDKVDEHDNEDKKRDKELKIDIPEMSFSSPRSNLH